MKLHGIAAFREHVFRERQRGCPEARRQDATRLQLHVGYTGCEFFRFANSQDLFSYI